MFERIRVFLMISAISALCSCSSSWRSEPPPEVDGALAFKLAGDVVAIGPRPSGTKGAEKNAAFIADYLKKLGVEVSIDEWREGTPLGTLTFRNVVANIPGRSGKYVLIGCHYDTKRLLATPGFVGANDGASGVGLLLAMADAIVKNGKKPPLSLKLVFFDGEECIESYSKGDGLHGSRRMRDRLKKQGALSDCRAMVLLDMIGDKELNVTIPSGATPELSEMLLAAAKRRGCGKHFERSSHDILDDHTPFQRAGVPVIDVIDFEFGPSNRYWHTGEDTLDKISAESLGIVGNVVLDMVWRL